jgi:Holliday junction resolvase RusA-like endonuclease
LSEPRTHTFRVEYKPAAFSRETAVLSHLRRKSGRNGGHMPDNIRAWRDAIVTEYKATVRESKTARDFPQDGEYLGRVGFEVEVYGSSADILNIGKEIEDALIGVAYKDDCQVVAWSIGFPNRTLTKNGTPTRVKESDEPGALVTIYLYDAPYATPTA